MTQQDKGGVDEYEGNGPYNCRHCLAPTWNDWDSCDECDSDALLADRSHHDQHHPISNKTVTA